MTPFDGAPPFLSDHPRPPRPPLTLRAILLNAAIALAGLLWPAALLALVMAAG